MNPKNKANSGNNRDHHHPKSLGVRHQLEGLMLWPLAQIYWNFKAVINMAIIIYKEVITSL